MLSKRFWGLLLVGILFVMFSMSVHTSVQADDFLQDVPRLDGVNIYFAETENEASRFDRSDDGLSRFAGLLTQLGANLLTLEWHTGFPTDADLIVIAGPTSDLQPDQIARLWSYINNHGRLLLLTAANTRGGHGGLPSTSGLFSLMWADMGIEADDDVVVKESVPTLQATEAATSESSTATEAVAAAATAVGQSPALITNFTTSQVNTSHPITASIAGDLAFSFSRSLQVDASIQGFQVSPLIFSSSDFYGETDFPTYLDAGTYSFDIGQDITRGPLPLAAAYENDKTSSRLVVIGDRQFATNGAGLRTSPSNSAGFVYPNNAYFLINSVTWLLNKEPVTLQFPTPGPTATPTMMPSPTFFPTATASPTVVAQGATSIGTPTATSNS